MQMKKEEVRLAILKQAEKEFYEHGFERASLRKIVKEAGTTIGNFYNYFKSKEELFNEIVHEDYIQFVNFVHSHHEIERPNYLWGVADPVEWRKVLSLLIPEIMPTFGKRFVILVEGSKGTKYENTADQIIHVMVEHFNEHIKEFNDEYKYPEMAPVIAEQFLSGLLSILKKYPNDEEKRVELITEYLLFLFIGAMSIVGKF